MIHAQPEAVRRSRPKSAGLASLLAALGIAIASVAGMSAASAASAGTAAGGDLLARELVDVALLPPRVPGGTPRLLTVTHLLSAREVVRLTVLERGLDDWGARREAEDRPRILGAIATPWLVALDERRFALLAVVPELGETWIRPVAWTGEELRLGARAHLGHAVDAAGAADVDADGTRELVLVATEEPRDETACVGTVITVLEPEGLGVLSESRLPNLQLGAATSGSLDEEAGDELVTAAARTCSTGPASRPHTALVAVRLADGAVLLERDVAAAERGTAWSGRPRIADLDGDGQAEVLIGSGGGLAIVEPHAGWASRTLPSLPGALAGLRVEGPGRPRATVATVDQRALMVGRLESAGGRWRLGGAQRIGAREVGAAAWEAAAIDRQHSALQVQGATDWLDPAGPCPRLVVALAVVPCDGPPDLGPAWLATRPVARVSSDRGGSLLVARADDWAGVPSRLTAPSPLAVEPGIGALRHGPSGRFVLSETVGELTDRRQEPAPTIARFVGPVPEVSVRAPAASRVLVAVLAAAEEGVAVPDSLSALLAPGRRRNQRLSLAPPDPAAAASRDVRLPLPAGSDRWDVAALAIGPLGDVSPVERGGVTIDTVGPSVALEAPFLSLPWPLGTTLRGETEAGATLTAGGRALEVGPDGAFEVQAALAPWPQRLDLVATDEAGNVTSFRVDVVGGLDWRRLPWAAILLAVLLAGTLLGGRGTRPAPRPPESDAPNGIEEIHHRRLGPPAR